MSQPRRVVRSGPLRFGLFLSAARLVFRYACLVLHRSPAVQRATLPRRGRERGSGKLRRFRDGPRTRFPADINLPVVGQALTRECLVAVSGMDPLVTFGRNIAG
jgi:hypothetical protein